MRSFPYLLSFSATIVLIVIWRSYCSIVRSDVKVTAVLPNIKARRVLVVAGNFSIDGELVNIAQYDIATKEWVIFIEHFYTKFSIKNIFLRRSSCASLTVSLFLFICIFPWNLVWRWSTKYESELYLYGESNGIIWDIVVNRTSQPFNKLIVVGAFDTVSETSQIQFCSVGEWDGLSFDKVSFLDYFDWFELNWIELIWWQCSGFSAICRARKFNVV